MRRCRCSLVGPRWAPDPLVKEQELLREMCIRRAKVSLRGTPGPIVSSSDCLCSLSNDPLKSGAAKARPAGLATPPASVVFSESESSLPRNKSRKKSPTKLFAAGAHSQTCSIYNLLKLVYTQPVICYPTLWTCSNYQNPSCQELQVLLASEAISDRLI